MIKVVAYTAFALLAFACNSILCRWALGSYEADAAGFTAVRLLSGAVALIVISYLGRGPHVSKGVTRNIDSYALAHAQASAKDGLLQYGNWPSALLLFAYAICFSFAYLGLSAGTGALILFGSVQLTMILLATVRGERPRPLEWLGLTVALAGLIYLVFPALESPPLTNSLLMAAAGAAWGLYTMRGKASSDPLAETTGNFVRTLPMAAVVALIFLPNLSLTNRGIVLAVLSGSIASGIGYAVWYAVLKHHTSTRAAVLQLSVPVITAFIGVAWLGETASATLLIASVAVLGGIALTILGRPRLT